LLPATLNQHRNEVVAGNLK